MNIFNRLAHREFLVLVAIAASALTLQIRQHSVDTAAQNEHAARLDHGRICEPPAADPAKLRVLPADCGISTDMRPQRAHASWV
ncbi:hypothetical protein AWB77_03517 [Caballeronia fortuita]|uniref:Uncharacterized protein n=1 Tax=Caballeronia fortuita TaxID=1777138 RepID=A0A158C188_9BURK|nr:hypothetical protein [Caballeronia fortuita]SAK76020.1 hypothetical protein AWB77_03517 [Caballeronia fortuita]